MKMFTLLKSDLVRTWREFQFHILNQLRWITTWALWLFEANTFFLPGDGVISGFVERLGLLPSLLLRLCSSPTSHYPMMMLPSGQAVPVLPGPVQMPSVINVRPRLPSPHCTTFQIQFPKTATFWSWLFTPVCLFARGGFPPAGPTDVHGTKHSWDPRPASRRQQQRLQLPLWLQHQL